MKLKSIAAILVAGLMVVSVPMVAMAEDIKVQINDSNVDTYATDGVISNNITVKGANAVSINTRDVKIEGNVTEGNNGKTTWTVMIVNGEGSGNVEVTGNVTNEGAGDGVNVQGSHTVNIGGSITTEGTSDSAINASSGATVTAGSVKAAITGVNATGTGTTVDVTGLVKSTVINATAAGINASNGATVTAGSVEAGMNGIKVSGNASVVVYGDVKGLAAISFNNKEAGDKGGTVTVLGTVDGSAYDVVVNDITDKTYSLFAYEIKDGLTCRDTGNVSNSAIKDQVFYIVKTSGVGDIASLTDKNNNQYTTSVDGKTYYGVKASDAKDNPVVPPSVQMGSAGEGYIVRVTEVPGYVFKSMSSTKGILTANGDGTYTLIVPEGGGVTLDLVYEAIRKAGGGDFTSTPTSMGSASAPLTGGTWTNVNEVWTYTNNGEKLINTTVWIQYTNALGQTVTQKFYFDNNGNMITNAWKQTADGVWNYFGADGAMLVNTTTPDGYVVDANGNWVKAQ